MRCRKWTISDSITSYLDRRWSWWGEVRWGWWNTPFRLYDSKEIGILVDCRRYWAAVPPTSRPGRVFPPYFWGPPGSWDSSLLGELCLQPVVRSRGSTLSISPAKKEFSWLQLAMALWALWGFNAWTFYKFMIWQMICVENNLLKPCRYLSKSL